LLLTRHDRITAAAADPLVSRTSHVGIGRSFLMPKAAVKASR
jgi:hypothetical protein